MTHCLGSPVGLQGLEQIAKKIWEKFYLKFCLTLVFLSVNHKAGSYIGNLDNWRRLAP